MPQRALRPCRRVGCPELVRVKDGLCDQHRKEGHREYNKRAPRKNSPYGTQRWKGLRTAHLVAHPFCEECGKIATLAHHIEDWKGNHALFWDPNNLQALCVSCHEAKHRRGWAAS